jgi:hypothetical protein
VEKSALKQCRRALLDAPLHGAQIPVEGGELPDKEGCKDV